MVSDLIVFSLVYFPFQPPRSVWAAKVIGRANSIRLRYLDSKVLIIVWFSIFIPYGFGPRQSVDRETALSSLRAAECVAPDCRRGCPGQFFRCTVSKIFSILVASFRCPGASFRCPVAIFSAPSSVA